MKPPTGEQAEQCVGVASGAVAGPSCVAIQERTALAAALNVPRGSCSAL